ncbi:hypothetical protein [Acinetobacter sp. ANC 4648]|uniref:hypothetical protein n=1 Tax=Acinetobacter sp. ANC 4648 TaxID=1977875 RepID=UPI00148A9FEF|nr:hypothetical protein [Acinetobacter sp. ANC 4648]
MNIFLHNLSALFHFDNLLYQFTDEINYKNTFKRMMGLKLYSQYIATQNEGENP